MSSELSARKQEELPEESPKRPVPAAGEVRAELVKVQNSDPFVRSQRIKDLLEFLVESVLAGNQKYLKESLIGVEVFGRSPDYDSKQDPVVRVEMRRLRSKLSEYYLHEGKLDEVVIWLEKGIYVPSLSRRGVDISVVAPPVTLVVAAPDPPGIPVAPNQPARRFHVFRWVAIASAVLLCAGVLAIFLGLPPKSPPSLRLVPLTGNAGLEMSPAFSPDGKLAAYSWEANRRNFDIYVKPITGGAPHRLTDSAAHDINPAWSPDGRQIAFLRVFPAKTEVLVIPSTSGIEKVICNLPVSVSRWHPEEPENNGAGGPVWSPDGSYLLVAGSLRTDSAIGILKIDLVGKQASLVTPPPGTIDTSPKISPSGDWIAFTRNWGANSFDLFVMPSHGGAPMRLTSDGRDIQGLTWLDNHHIIYSSNRAGRFRLWQIDRSGGESMPVFVAGSQPQWPAISRDGHWLAYVEAMNAASIWRLPLGASRPSAPPEPVLSSAGQDYNPAYSPDGKKVAFISDRSGSVQIWTSDADGANVAQLTNFQGSTLGSLHWSPDSRRLVFDGGAGGYSAIWLIDVDGSNLHRLNNSTGGQYLPSWSRDGHWIYFCSTGKGGGLWKQNPDSGQSVELTKTTFFDATESADGRTVYVQLPRRGTWWFPAAGGTPAPVPELEAVDAGRYWDLAGDTIYFVRQEKRRHELESFNLTTRKFQKLAIIPAELMVGTPGLSVDPARNSLLFVQKDQHRSSVMLQER
jgi:Tol biopolymer transport system component